MNIYLPENTTGFCILLQQKFRTIFLFMVGGVAHFNAWPRLQRQNWRDRANYLVDGDKWCRHRLEVWSALPDLIFLPRLANWRNEFHKKKIEFFSIEKYFYLQNNCKKWKISEKKFFASL